LQSESFISYYQGDTSSPAEVDSYDYGAGAVGLLLQKVITAYSIIGSSVVPTSVVIKDSSNNSVALTTMSYDETAVTTTSGTPQHSSVSGGRSNLTTVATQVSSTKTLYRKVTYYDTGTVNTAYGSSLSSTTNGPATSYVYDNTGTPSKSCGNSFPTTVNLSIAGLSSSFAWNCNGGVQRSVTDENGKIWSVAYDDPYFWRATGSTDELNYVTGILYSGATAVTTSLPTNPTTWVAELRAQVDGLGRPILSQRRQGPGATNYDTVETDYDSVGRIAKATLPFAAAAGATNAAAPGTTYSSYDGLGRPLALSDSGGGSINYTYAKNDVLLITGPAPVGESTKARQLEYDALGRLTSVCEVTNATDSGSCGQTNAQAGYWTRYKYDALGNQVGVCQKTTQPLSTDCVQTPSTGQQTRTYTYDMTGRITSETNPETGTTNYTYDSDPACGGTSYPGSLVKRADTNGNATCYAYDSLQRVLSVSYLSGGPNVASTPTKYFVYDTTPVNGVTVQNPKGRMVEAYTCMGGCTPKATDLIFSYSARGEINDVYESTPHSGTGYYHSNSQYWATGATNTLSLLNASGTALFPAITYGVDGEGRASAISAAIGTTPVYSTSYNAASQVTGVNFMATNSDNDVFVYDATTLRLTDYQFNIGATVKQDWGHLTWNQNGTLGSLSINDQWNSMNNQNCNYTYDDLGRLASKNHTTPNIVCGTKWSQTITLDPFGNISKSATVGTNFQATYTSSPPTNRISQLGSLSPAYDANGNLTYDAITSTTHQYTWDAEGKMSTIDNGASGGVCLTYDALGRMAEQGWGSSCSTFTQIVYAPTGFKLALMSG
jgi:YD repeat-containing protein